MKRIGSMLASVAIITSLFIGATFPVAAASHGASTIDLSAQALAGCNAGQQCVFEWYDVLSGSYEFNYYEFYQGYIYLWPAQCVPNSGWQVTYCAPTAAGYSMTSLQNYIDIDKTGSSDRYADALFYPNGTIGTYCGYTTTWYVDINGSYVTSCI